MKQKSRATRFDEAKSTAVDQKAEFEELRDELQNWLDSLPENLQSGSKANALEEAISNLEEAIDALDTLEGIEVEFPGMFG